MERRTEAIDMTALAARIRPLAHQASVGLGQASQDVRETLDDAGDAIVTRVADGWDGWDGALRSSPALLAIASRLRQPLALRAVTWGLGRWLLLATVVTVLTALAAAATASAVRTRRARRAEAVPVTAPVVIPVSAPTEGPENRSVEALRSA